jgi:hypothetical protein
MGMHLGWMIFLQEKGLLSAAKNRILDIGPQNVYHVTEDQIDEFVRNQGATVDAAKLETERKRLAYYSTPRPEETTTLFSEICDLTNIEYNSFDVCPALKTELLDLNYDQLPEKYQEYYDVVVNFGTTEHIFNQWNSFKVIHDALKVGGVVYHQLPASGYLDHGYYCYTPLFFEELAKANVYEAVEMFFTPAGENFVGGMGIDVLGSDAGVSVPHPIKLGSGEDRVPCFNIHVILRKTRRAAFRVALEIATAHASAYEEILSRYGDTAQSLSPADTEESITESAADRDRKVAQLVNEREEARMRGDRLAQQLHGMERSRSWRYTEPLRHVLRILARRA